MKEFEIFQKAREIELKQGLAAYADCHIDFYKKVKKRALFFLLKSETNSCKTVNRVYQSGKIFYRYWIKFNLKINNNVVLSLAFLFVCLALLIL